MAFDHGNTDVVPEGLKYKTPTNSFFLLNCHESSKNKNK